jgi:hypothetical protein
MATLVLIDSATTAGAVVHGRLEGDCDPIADAAVELVRIEQSPSGSRTFRVATAGLADDGSFALGVPDDAPPAVIGQSCALGYAVRTRVAREELLAPLAVTA